MSDVKIQISRKVAILYGTHTVAGMACLHQLIDDDAYSLVKVICLNSPKIIHKKLKSVIIEDESLVKLKDHLRGDDLFIFQSNYFDKRNDPDQYVNTNYSLPVRIALYAKQNNVNQISLLSSFATVFNSFFLPHKTRVELERNIIELDFWSCYIYKPTIIVSTDKTNDLGSKLNGLMIDKVNALAGGLMQKISPVKTKELVTLMIRSAQGLEGGLHIVTNEMIVSHQNDNA